MSRKRSAGVLPYRIVAVSMALALAGACLAGCGRQQVKGYRGTPSNNAGQNQPSGHTGLTTKQKVAVLAGAAALYYLYNRHKNASGEGRQGQYYLSKNGRVYYRDRSGNPVWVTPPQGGIRVPADEAQGYEHYQGYNGRQTGQGFGGYGSGGRYGTSGGERQPAGGYGQYGQ